MDINTTEAQIIKQRIADGHFQLVPEGLRDGRRHQVYGVTTKNRVYRFDEDSDQYSILVPRRDRFQMVRGLLPGEAVRRDTHFDNMNLLPDKTFYENCKERYVPDILWTAFRALTGSALVGALGYFVWHCSDIWRAVCDGVRGRSPDMLSANATTMAARNAQRHGLRASQSTAIPTRVVVREACPSETGWGNPLDAPMALAAQSAAPLAGAAGLAGPIAGAVVLGGGVAYIAHCQNQRLHNSQPGPRS